MPDYLRRRSGLWLPEREHQPRSTCSFLHNGLLASGRGIVTAGLVAWLDAANNSSYASGQTWANIETTPADSAVQTAYDFFRGTDNTVATDDPTFVGTAGNMSSGTYWRFDGGDHFELAAANTTHIDSLHKDAAKFTMEFWIWFDSVGGNFWSTTRTTPNIGMNIGSDGTVFYTTAAADVTITPTALGLSTGAWNMAALSYNEDGGASGCFWFKNGTAMTAFNGAYTTPSAAAATFRGHIGTAGDEAAGFFPNLTRLAIFRLYNTNLSAGQLAQNWAASRGRFGI